MEEIKKISLYRGVIKLMLAIIEESKKQEKDDFSIYEISNIADKVREEIDSGFCK